MATTGAARLTSQDSHCSAMMTWLTSHGFEDAHTPCVPSSEPAWNMMHPFTYACAKGDIEMVRCLLIMDGEETADIASSAEDFLGWQPILHAVFHGHLSICKLLVQKGASVEAKTRHGSSTFHWASENNDCEMLSWLASVWKGSKAKEIKALDGSNWSPFRRALRNQSFEACQWLIKEGALNGDDNHVDEYIIKRDLRPIYGQDHSPTLLAWAEDIIGNHDAFATTFTPFSKLLSIHAQHQVISFLGMESNQALHNIREFASILNKGKWKRQQHGRSLKWCSNRKSTNSSPPRRP